MAIGHRLKNRSVARYSNLYAGARFGLVNGLEEEIHQGVELKTSYKLSKNFKLNINRSLNDWTYSNDGQSTLFGTDKVVTSENKLWLKDLKNCKCPAIHTFAEAEYRWAHNFYIQLT